MKRLIYATAIAVALASPAAALTGAQVKQSSPLYGRAYIWGVLEGYLFIGGSDDSVKDQAQQQLRLKCLMDAKITDSTFYEAVMHHIDRTPANLTEHAVGAVLQTLVEMCDR
ncbi:hypothetical protein [Rhizobium ruizarguesonis]|uniref:hypothetical protein n=1 Tax=Rhizobium ruizarguesonis TaxID=2081791 RepID=UPI001030BC23|nr:hypothetical protein [Rhizobium ruizarguesonis]TAV04496.1 hypothetical protein ELI39_03925 [Rhizobium ruizarguesonis]